MDMGNEAPENVLKLSTGRIPLKIPQVNECRTAREFVERLLEINRESKAFSHRFLAKKLKFPTAYLSDVVKGRRRLNLARAVQMTQSLKMDPLDTDYLITLVLKDSSTGTARTYFEERTRKRFFKSDQMSTNDPEGRFSRIETLAINSLAPGLPARTAVDDLKRKLVTFPDLTRDEIAWTLAALVRYECLVVDDSGHYQFKKGVFIQSDNVNPNSDPVHRQYANNFIRYYELRYGPATMNSAFIRLPYHSFEKVRERIMQFRDWLFELNHPPGSKDEQLHMVFQFDLNMFPIHRKDE
jgi:uncharacterized protein (TIGR02147 family)